jgi:short-subunit dehydrogenase
LPKSVVVITGASSGIGMIFARRLAAGHDLLLIARRTERLEALAAELTALHGGAIAVLPADLTNTQDLATVADRIAGERNLALLVNNAGFGTRGLFWETELEGQEQMHRLHVAATVRLTHAALKNMVARNSGGIINVASVAAFVRRSGSASYGATKSWMTAFTEGLYLDLQSAQSAVKVQALCPGFTYSEFHDTMKVDRKGLAPASLWLNAEFVVDESLKALSRGKLFVVPGWRYQAIVALVTKLPGALRLAFEEHGSKTESRGKNAG